MGTGKTTRVTMALAVPSLISGRPTSGRMLTQLILAQYPAIIDARAMSAEMVLKDKMGSVTRMDAI